MGSDHKGVVQAHSVNHLIVLQVSVNRVFAPPDKAASMIITSQNDKRMHRLRAMALRTSAASLAITDYIFLQAGRHCKKYESYFPQLNGKTQPLIFNQLSTSLVQNDFLHQAQGRVLSNKSRFVLECGHGD